MLRIVSFGTSSRSTASRQARALASAVGIAARARRGGLLAGDRVVAVELLVDGLVVGATLAGEPVQQLPAQVGVDRRARRASASRRAARRAGRAPRRRAPPARGRAGTRAAGRCPARPTRTSSSRPASQRSATAARFSGAVYSATACRCVRRASGPRTGRSRRRSRAAPGRPSPTRASRRRGSCPRPRPRTAPAAATR